MRRHPRDHSILGDTMSLAGWLYADLLLGLAMLFFVFNTVGPKPPLQLLSPTPTLTASPTPTLTASPTPTLTASPTPTLTASPTPTSITVLSTQPETLTFQVNADRLLTGDVAERDQAQQQIRASFAQYAGSRIAGFVLTFGTSDNSNEATQLSREINQLLVTTIPEVFGQSVRRDFISLREGASRRGQIEIEVYFLAAGS